LLLMLLRLCTLLLLFLLSLNATDTSDIYTLSLHDALPIYSSHWGQPGGIRRCPRPRPAPAARPPGRCRECAVRRRAADRPAPTRSEEHTSELQSRFDLVCRLLLEKTNNNRTNKSVYWCAAW